MSPDKIVVYSTQNCGYCRRWGFHFLRNVKEVEVDVVDLSGDLEARKALIAERLDANRAADFHRRDLHWWFRRVARLGPRREIRSAAKSSRKMTADQDSE